MLPAPTRQESLQCFLKPLLSSMQLIWKPRVLTLTRSTKLRKNFSNYHMQHLWERCPISIVKPTTQTACFCLMWAMLATYNLKCLLLIMEFCLYHMKSFSQAILICGTVAPTQSPCLVKQYLKRLILTTSKSPLFVFPTLSAIESQRTTERRISCFLNVLDKSLSTLYLLFLKIDGINSRQKKITRYSTSSSRISLLPKLLPLIKERRQTTFHPPNW